MGTEHHLRTRMLAMLVGLGACRPGAAVDLTFSAPPVTLTAFQVSLTVDEHERQVTTWDGGISLPTTLRLLVDEGTTAQVEAIGLDPTGDARAARGTVPLTPGGRSALTLDLSTPAACPPFAPGADELVLYDEQLPRQTKDPRFQMHAYDQWPDAGHDTTIESTTTACGGRLAYEVRLMNQFAGVGVFAPGGVAMRRIAFRFQASSDSTWKLYTQFFAPDGGIVDGVQRVDNYRANQWTLVTLDIANTAPLLEASFNYSGTTPITARIDDVRFVPR